MPPAKSITATLDGGDDDDVAIIDNRVQELLETTILLAVDDNSRKLAAVDIHERIIRQDRYQGCNDSIFTDWGGIDDNRKRPYFVKPDMLLGKVEDVRHLKSLWVTL